MCQNSVSSTVGCERSRTPPSCIVTFANFKFCLAVVSNINVAPICMRGTQICLIQQNEYTLN